MSEAVTTVEVVLTGDPVHFGESAKITISNGSNTLVYSGVIVDGQKDVDGDAKRFHVQGAFYIRVLPGNIGKPIPLSEFGKWAKREVFDVIARKGGDHSVPGFERIYSLFPDLR